MTAPEPGADRLLVVEMVGLLNDAEHYTGPGSDGDCRLTYLDRRAALLHRLVESHQTGLILLEAAPAAGLAAVTVSAV